MNTNIAPRNIVLNNVANWQRQKADSCRRRRHHSEEVEHRALSYGLRAAAHDAVFSIGDIAHINHQ